MLIFNYYGTDLRVTTSGFETNLGVDIEISRYDEDMGGYLFDGKGFVEEFTEECVREYLDERSLADY